QWLQDDLTTFGASNTINATLSNQTSTGADYSLTLNIPNSRSLKIFAKTFNLTDKTPTTSITGPNSSVIPTTTFTITGTGADDVGVNHINLELKDLNS